MNHHRELRGLAWLSTLSVVLISSPTLADQFDIVTAEPVADPGTEIAWRISSPNVKQPVTSYPQIQIRPGDVVTIDAGGCVQTGGHGKTWKRYVDPRGDSSDRLYHGLIAIPGAVPMQRIQVFGLNVPHETPPDLPGSSMALQLGYEDDNYSDNGYWGHDDGNPEQCKHVGNAWVTVKIQRLPTRTGTASPRYAVLTVVYAPPGSGAGGAASQVDYGNGSSTGTSTSSSSSFAQGYTVTASTGGNLFGPTASGSAQFQATLQSGNTSEIDVTKSIDQHLVVTGPNTDGIDHDLDAIYLWLNPVVNVSVTGTRIVWSLSASQLPMRTQYVYVAWLKNPARMPANVATTLRNFGITPADYPTILARDRFASGGGFIDPNRFVPTNTTFTYEPPYAPGDVGPSQPLTITSDQTQMSSTTSTDSYNIGMSVSTGFDIGILNASLGGSGSWTWTNTSTQGKTSRTTQFASLTVNYPSATYLGPTMIDVYWDTVYHSFLFAFDQESTPQAREAAASLKGQITAGGTVPAARQEVVLSLGGRTYRTFTNALGRYYFGKGLHGAGELSVRGVRHPILLGGTPVVHDLKL